MTISKTKEKEAFNKVYTYITAFKFLIFVWINMTSKDRINLISETLLLHFRVWFSQSVPQSFNKNTVFIRRTKLVLSNETMKSFSLTQVSLILKFKTKKAYFRNSHTEYGA